MNKKNIFVIGVLLVIFLASIFNILFFQNKPDSLLANYATTRARIGNKIYTLYIADTASQQKQGLSNIKKMARNVGLVFVFEKPGFYGFWMKDMKFPLDFVFLRNNHVVDLIANIEPESYPNTFTAKEAFDAVIELNAGEIALSHIVINNEIR